MGRRRVRQAIAYGIDRDAIVAATSYGTATVNQLAIPVGNPWYTPYDRYRSRTSTEPVSCSRSGARHHAISACWSPPNTPSTVTAAQVIADNLAPLGITVHIRTVDFATWLDEQNSGHFDMLMMGWLGNIDPDDFYYAQHHTDGSSNAQKFSNHQVDDCSTPGASSVGAPPDSSDYRAGRDPHRRRGQLHLPVQRVRSSKPGPPPCRGTRPVATAPSGSARHARVDPAGADMSPLLRIPGAAPAVLAGGVGRRADRGVRPGSAGARRPGAHRPRHALHAGGLRRPAFGKWTGPADLFSSSSATGLGVDRRPRRQLPQRRTRRRILLDRLPATISLALFGIVVALLIALPAGIWSALHEGMVDAIVRVTSQFGVSIPDFWMGILLIALFSTTLGWLPTSGYRPLSRIPAGGCATSSCPASRSDWSPARS